MMVYRPRGSLRPPRSCSSEASGILDGGSAMGPPCRPTRPGRGLPPQFASGRGPLDLRRPARRGRDNLAEEEDAIGPQAERQPGLRAVPAA